MLRVKVSGAGMLKPQTGELVYSTNVDKGVCWSFGTDCNEESFLVRQADFPRANDPSGDPKATLKPQIDRDGGATRHSDTLRPFRRPKSGRIVLKVGNHLKHEVMKVSQV